MKLLDLLKMANAGRNKQQHRAVAGTKRARQLMARHGGQGVTAKPQPAAVADPENGVFVARDGKPYKITPGHE